MTQVLPDFHSYLASMKRRSASVTSAFQRLTYGDDPRQYVEWTGTPSKDRPLPVFIHGGYWRALTAQDHRFVLPAIQSATGAVANLEYRLLPHVTLRDIVMDAVQGLHALSERFHCPLVVIGHSAGGHLAAMAARQIPDRIVAAIGISGLYDLTPLQWSFLREEVGLTLADLRGQSPQDVWEGHDASHITVAVGANETPEFLRQSHMFANAHGALSLTIPDAHHMTVLDDLADPQGVMIAHLTTILATSHSNL
ncbi:alpha/beta hydrolase [Roseobacter fucihabitans]|nr:alpha/beta hydrolase [Roseobacter litoralis]